MTITLTFLGAGSAFTTAAYYQSNLLLTADNGRHMLIDCGSDIRFSLAEWSLGHEEAHAAIQALYVSHLHSDHIGGLEWLAFKSYFSPGMERPTLFLVEELADRLWENALRGGLESIEEKQMGLSDYFAPEIVTPGQPFYWENICLTPFRTVHVNNPQYPMYSYGLVIQERGKEEAFIFTADTILHPELLQLFEQWVPRTRAIFQDCETTAVPSGVHAHYTELRTLPLPLRRKMWLYHYNPHPPYHPEEEGFLGFVRKGQHFRLG
ncbi:MAG: MBL fold metallo-hydrolase [Magnetococcales bacterium]|nr:MBL fold metallo-hydrolase [Magnetococcales bacterium]